MDYKLTKDADKAICKIYGAYLSRRELGHPKGEAKCFDDCDEWLEALFPGESRWDVMETISELCRAFKMKRYTAGGFVLSDDAIIYMENRFPNGASQIFEWLGKIKNVFPFP